MQRQEWTLLAISAAKGQPLSPVQLQKSLFLLGQSLPNEVGDNYYKFTPYNYGPFDASIYSDAKRLAEEGLITIASPIGQRWSEYTITPDGLKYVLSVQTQVSNIAANYLEEVVDWVLRLKFEELIKTIYKYYPQFQVNSVFRG